MKNITSRVMQTYDEIGLAFSATRPRLAPEVISLLPTLPPKAQVLDLGCGNGVLLTAFDRRSLLDHRSLGEVGGEGGPIDYTGIDISPVMIKEATGLHPVAKFVLADISDQAAWRQLGQYDFIAALAVFHHLPRRADHLALLSQIKNHLQPGGSALISVWNLNRPKFDRYRRGKCLSIPFHPARNASSIADAGGGGPKRFFYAFTDEELTELAKQAGFSNIKTISIKDNLYFKLA